MKKASGPGASSQQGTHQVVHDDGVMQWVAGGCKSVISHYRVEPALSVA